MFRDHAEAVREFYRGQGRTEERKENIFLLRKFICYDASKHGDCPHGACEQIMDAISLLKTKP